MTPPQCFYRRKNKLVLMLLVKKQQKHDDEIKHYLDVRYVYAIEAAWRLFGLDIHY